MINIDDTLLTVFYRKKINIQDDYMGEIRLNKALQCEIG